MNLSASGSLPPSAPGAATRILAVAPDAAASRARIMLRAAGPIPATVVEVTLPPGVRAGSAGPLVLAAASASELAAGASAAGLDLPASTPGASPRIRLGAVFAAAALLAAGSDAAFSDIALPEAARPAGALAALLRAPASFATRVPVPAFADAAAALEEASEVGGADALRAGSAGAPGALGLGAPFATTVAASGVASCVLPTPRAVMLPTGPGVCGAAALAAAAFAAASDRASATLPDSAFAAASPAPGERGAADRFAWRPPVGLVAMGLLAAGPLLARLLPWELPASRLLEPGPVAASPASGARPAAATPPAGVGALPRTAIAGTIGVDSPERCAPPECVARGTTISITGAVRSGRDAER